MSDVSATEYPDFGAALYGQFDRGEGSIDDRTEAFKRALAHLVRRAQHAHGSLPHPLERRLEWDAQDEIAGVLSDAGLLALHLLEMLDPYGQSDLKLEVRHRNAGPPKKWDVERQRKEHRAARLVERLEARGRQKSWAVSHVADKREIGRSALYQCMKARARFREILPDASERELLSALLWR